MTYDEFGGYGHPDHIQAHRVATYAAALAAVPSYRRDLGEAWDVAKIYWGAMSESRMRAGLRALREAGDTTTFEGMDPDGPLPHFVVPDDDLTAEVDGTDHVDRKMAALARARHPDHARRAVLRAVQQPRRRRLGPGVLPDRQGHGRGRSATTGWRPTSSRVSDVGDRPLPRMSG